MQIAWKYLNKRAAALDALKDYGSMQFILEHTDENIRAEHEKMQSVRSPSFDGMPHVHNPQASEQRILNGIEEIDVLRERYRQALEYMAWFQPAWDDLTEDEQYVLREFYMCDEGQQIDAVYNICDHFHIERSSAYNKKNRALDRLSTLLYGKR